MSDTEIAQQLYESIAGNPLVDNYWNSDISYQLEDLTIVEGGKKEDLLIIATNNLSIFDNTNDINYTNDIIKVNDTNDINYSIFDESPDTSNSYSDAITFVDNNQEGDKEGDKEGNKEHTIHAIITFLDQL